MRIGQPGAGATRTAGRSFFLPATIAQLTEYYPSLMIPIYRPVAIAITFVAVFLFLAWFNSPH